MPQGLGVESIKSLNEVILSDNVKLSSVEPDNKPPHDIEDISVSLFYKSVTTPTNSRATNTNTLPLSPLIKVELW